MFFVVLQLTSNTFIVFNDHYQVAGISGGIFVMVIKSAPLSRIRA
jgi:hypothetical protein